MKGEDWRELLPEVAAKSKPVPPAGFCGVLLAAPKGEKAGCCCGGVEENGLKGGAAADEGVGGKVGKEGAGEEDEPGSANGEENEEVDDATLPPPNDGKLLLLLLMALGNDEPPNGEGAVVAVAALEAEAEGAPNTKGLVDIAEDEPDENVDAELPKGVVPAPLPPKLND